MSPPKFLSTDSGIRNSWLENQPRYLPPVWSGEVSGPLRASVSPLMGRRALQRGRLFLYHEPWEGVACLVVTDAAAVPAQGLERGKPWNNISRSHFFWVLTVCEELC